MALDESDWRALADIVGSDKISDLRPRYLEFTQTTADTGRDMFARYLYRQGLLTEQQLVRALRVRLRPELTVASNLEPSARRVGADPESSPSGQYALLGVVGSGAHGRVWVAKDRDLRRKVAWKQLDSDAGADGLRRQRFVAEAQITAQLDHPSVPPVYAIEADADGEIGYAMKLVEGRTLRERLAECYAERVAGRPSPVTLADRLEWFLKICEAVAYAHSRDVIHRDLKPDNVLVGPFGEVWVTDWGAARIAGEASSAPRTGTPGAFSDSLSTQAGEVEGTPAHMAPEQARGEPAGPAADQYSLGLLLQEIITLVHPVKAVDAHLARLAAMKGQREPLPGQVHRALRAIVGRACALEPARRYPSVAHLAADVRRHLRDEPVAAAPEGLFRTAYRALVRHREWVLLGGVGVLVLGVVVAVSSVNLMFAERWSATARQERLGAGISRIGEQAHRIDKEILEYDRRLEVAAGSATQLLLHGVGDAERPIHDSASFADPARRPADLTSDPRFGVATSRGHPVFHAAPGTSAARLEDTARRLVHLQAELNRQAGPGSPPIGWTFVGTEEGVHMSWPGHAGLAPDYDPRTRPWYTQARTSTTPVWGAPYVDAGGLCRFG
jgi:serine/threonine protein kinase